MTGQPVDGQVAGLVDQRDVEAWADGHGAHADTPGELGEESPLPGVECADPPAGAGSRLLSVSATSASDLPSRSENITPKPSAFIDSNATGIPISGTNARPDCFAASSAMRCQRATRFVASAASRR